MTYKPRGEQCWIDVVLCHASRVYNNTVGLMELICFYNILWESLSPSTYFISSVSAAYFCLFDFLMCLVTLFMFECEGDWKTQRKDPNISSAGFLEEILSIFSIHYSNLSIVLTANILTNLLSGAVYVEKLIGSQLVKKLPVFYGIRIFVTTFTTAHQYKSRTNLVPRPVIF